MSGKQDFRVIIVGGSVSGLTLAHCLYHAGIDFIVLEKGKEIAFGGGASIGLQPHGLRIMDQLGMYSSILATTKPIHEAVHRRADGSIVARSHFARQIEERHGYPILFFERSELLGILYDHLPVKEKVLTNHEVVDIKTDRFDATVTTKNGATFRGHMVVGADGINSKVRRSVWDLIKARDPAAGKKAESSITSDYNCTFGVSIYDFKDPDLTPGTSQVVSNKARSNIVITSTNNRVFWFLILKHDKKYTYPNIPRYNNEKATEIMESVVSEFQATKITGMKDVWDKRTKFAMVSLEEVVFDDWAEERLVLVGDSAHKVTPNAGHGGNTAIESAAVLANLLHDAKTGTKGSLDYAGLQGIFREYRENRKNRVDFVSTASSAATRLQACENIAWKTAASLIPLLGEDFEVNASSDMIMGGEPLKFIEYQGKEGNVPWAGWTLDNVAEGPELSSADKFVQKFGYLVIPAIAIWFIIEFRRMEHSSSAANLNAFDPSGIFNYFLDSNNGNKSKTLPSSLAPFSKETLTRPWAAFVACMNFLPIGAIVAVEGCRSNNAKSLSTKLWATVIALQFGGLSPIAALFLFAHCVESNLSTRISKGYILPLKYSRSLVPAILISVALAMLLAFAISGLISSGDQTGSQSPAQLIQTFPILPYLATLSLGRTKNSKSRNTAFGHEDVSSVQGTLMLSALISTITHIINVIGGVFTLHSINSGPIIHLIIGGNVLNESQKPKYLIFTAVALIWCYSTAMKVLPPQRRNLEIKMNMAVRMATGTVLIGPGAVMGLLWLWREDKVRCMDSQWSYAMEIEKEAPST